ncbi:MAG: hypothetical protein ACRDLS_11680 [Solirubrobacteraceae bacterium]
MADREDDEREVLTSLPRSRPVRRSAKRGERARPEGGAATAAASPSTSAPRRKPQAKTARKPASNGASQTAPKSARSAPAAKARKPRGEATKKSEPRIAPERKVPPAGYAAPSKSDGDSSPGATEILVTAVQAATELAQIGLSVGRQALTSALERLPKP